jgi:hypothetical protein
MTATVAAIPVPAARQHAGDAGQRDGDVDDQRNPPVVGGPRTALDSIMAATGHDHGERRNTQHASGKQRAGGDRQEARRVRQPAARPRRNR